MGRAEDKAQKNLLCATRTPGVEDLQSRAYTGDKGLTLVEYAPFGVVAAITPSNNPAATVISNAIAILAAAIPWSSPRIRQQPRSARTRCAPCPRPAVSVGAPKGLITTVSPTSRETTKALLSHPEVDLNMVTGGPAIVKVAMTTGKTCKTIAAGPGNPPVVVDETASSPSARGHHIGRKLRQQRVVHLGKRSHRGRGGQGSVPGEYAQGSAGRRAFSLSDGCLDEARHQGGGEGCKDPVMNRDYVGRDAAVIAKGIGLDVPPATRLLWGEVPNDHPFVWIEQLMPVLPSPPRGTWTPPSSWPIAPKHATIHSAAMYSTNIGHLTRMGRRMQCSIYVKNAPTLYGLGLGEGYASMSIGTPTGDGITKALAFRQAVALLPGGYFRIA